jgi:hypothetical protein
MSPVCYILARTWGERKDTPSCPFNRSRLACSALLNQQWSFRAELIGAFSGDLEFRLQVQENCFLGQ